MVSKIKKLALLLCVLMTAAVTLLAQDAIVRELLKKYTYEFTIKNGQLTGEGAAYLQKKIESSQFVLLGENHSSSQIAKLTRALIPLLAQNEFKNMAIETGPVSAGKLEELSTPETATAQQLKAFNKKYYNGKFPIPFFTGKEDAAFLQEASKNKMSLWGLDQEFNNANEYLLDELLNSIKGHESYNELARMKEEAVVGIRNIQKTGTKTECRMLKDSLILKFFASFESNNVKAQEIITAIKKSWEIYCLYEEQKYRENNTQRAEYMKTNFMSEYQNAKVNGQVLPKVFIKMGHGHVTIGNSPLGVEDIGKMVHQLAQSNGTGSLHIAQRQRYWKTKTGITIDYMNKYYKGLTPVMKLAKKNKWVLVDLQKFRQENKELILSKEMEKEIASYDMLLLCPADKKVKKNR